MTFKIISFILLFYSFKNSKRSKHSSNVTSRMRIRRREISWRNYISHLCVIFPTSINRWFEIATPYRPRYTTIATITLPSTNKRRKWLFLFHETTLLGDRQKGWQFGENLRTQSSGWFPLAYTEIIIDDSLG